MCVSQSFVKLMLIVIIVTSNQVAASIRDLIAAATEHNEHGEVLVKSMSAKVQGILPHGYDPIHKSTSFLLDSKFLHPVILGES